MKLITGNVIEIFLKEIDRYVYVKYINVKDFIEHVNYSFQFRVYGGFFETPVEDTKALDFKHLLFSPLHLTGFKELLRTKKWTINCKNDITPYDTKQHHYKMAWPPSLIVLFPDVQQWRVLEEINNINDGKIVPYQKCAHLEYVENLGADHLKLRIHIEYCKIARKELNIEYATLDRFEQALLSRYTNMPVYVDLPDEYKGRLPP